MAIALKDFWSLRYSASGGPVTAVVSQRLGALLAWVAMKLGVSPNALTIAGGGVSLGGALVYSGVGVQGMPLWGVFAVLQLGYVFDCADGQLARATRRQSVFGGWLDVVVDFAAQIALGLAVLFYLAGSAEQSDAALICGIVGVYLFSRVALVFTGKVGSDHRKNAGAMPPASRSSIKTVLWFVLDTPVLLTMVCVLKPWPDYLVVYLVLMAVAYLSNTAYLAVRLLK